jgi:hypothetical protein
MSEPAPPPPSPAPSRGEPPRIRFVALRVSRAPSGRCRAEVELQSVDGRTLCGAADVQAIAEGDLRAAAAATLDALHQAGQSGASGGKGPRFALLGVKNVRAFDQHVILVQLGAESTSGEPPRRLMGSAFADADLMRAAVLAVLNASNRVLWGPHAA